jgi:hypothetical protein
MLYPLSYEGRGAEKSLSQVIRRPSGELIRARQRLVGAEAAIFPPFVPHGVGANLSGEAAEAVMASTATRATTANRPRTRMAPRRVRGDEVSFMACSFGRGTCPRIRQAAVRVCRRQHTSSVQLDTSPSPRTGCYYDRPRQ